MCVFAIRAIHFPQLSLMMCLWPVLITSGTAERDINQQFELSIVRDEIQIYITMCNPRQEALSKTGAPASTMTSSVSTTVSVVSTYLASSVSGVAGTLLLTSPEWQKDAPHQLHQWKVHSMTDDLSFDKCDFQGVSSVCLKIHISRQNEKFMGEVLM